MAQDLLPELHRRGIRLRLADGRLDVLAPPGSLTAELRDRLREYRDELVVLLGRAAADGPTPLVARPEARFDPFPLTDVQHAYWMGRNTSVELGGISTHFYAESERDDLDVGRLTTSLRKVIDRHEMLRAVVQPDGTQRVLPEVPPYEIAVTDLRGLDPVTQEAELARIREEVRRDAHGADCWPLFEVRATRLTDRRLRLHMRFDMLIVDGRSLESVYQDWRRFHQDPDWAPEPLPISYRDCVLAERARRADAAYARAREYWLGRLDELPPPPALPLATQPAQITSPRFHRRDARLPGERWAALKRIAGSRGLTPSAVLMTAFGDVLRRWSGQPAVTLNLTLFNRPRLHPRIDEVVGDFTSLTMLAVDGAAEDSFGARAQRLHRQLLLDLDHLSYTGVQVLRERARRLGGRPGAIMPVVFTSRLGASPAADAVATRDEVLGELVHAISQTPQVWLDHTVAEERGELLLNWDAVEDLFPDRLLDDMFDAYRGLLERLAADEAAWDVAGAAVPIPGWQLAERAAVNDTVAPIPERTLSEIVAEQAVRSPDAVAVIADDGQFTYAQLMAEAHRLARRLVALGAVTGTLVGVVLEKGREQIAAVLGVACSGAAYVPIDPGWPEARRDSLLERCGVRMVVTTQTLRAELTWPTGVTVVTLADEEVRAAEAGPLETTPRPQDLAYVIFTSGSTGQPKGVVIDHRGAANTVQDINARFRVGPSDRVLALSALSFDLSVYDVFGTLAAGGAVVVPSPRLVHDPAHWSDLVARHGVTVWNSVPALLQTWIDDRGHRGAPTESRLRLAMLSGDWIPVTLPDAVRGWLSDLEVISLGGATEASIWSVAYPIGKVPPEWVRIPYGKPLARQTLHVYDNQLQPCPVWTVGEIYIGGIGVAKEYWGDPQLTAERFIIHPRTGERLYRTGDLGRYLPGGDIEFLGRNDFQVKINGYRIELGEIEAVLLRRPEVNEAIAGVDTNPMTGRRHLVAYIVPAAGAAPEPATLRVALEEALPEYMVPHHYLVLDQLPKSSNGKVDRAALPTPWDEFEVRRERLAPRDDLERGLFGVWSRALGRDDFGIEDNFYELGGDSVNAVLILGAIRDELGITAASEDLLRWIFENPTVAALAGALRDSGGR
ncbi:amino acid adenylation domain-containing protein [Solwaraspora sp. WMMD1047]|uniref:non-ribosomal peptide synthetase n=1 Tax=Solwaraspora sp. WMMD1047 TaxID=3016102 RepID=UPI0024171989|nr:amino acid adenylation domain-containing protein [Solwaraspora sp. WMMD1047]MDG4830626.1 amino acid adenylation domain-containing protein [Solwaraspora sp. WMMD1047]